MAICTICGFVTEFLEQYLSNNGDERNLKCDKCEKVVIGKKEERTQERIWDTQTLIEVPKILDLARY